jgi:hypothetical protein
MGYFDRDAQSATSTVTLHSQPREGQEKGERRKEKGERRKEKGERRKEKGERRKEKGERRREKRSIRGLTIRMMSDPRSVIHDQ